MKRIFTFLLALCLLSSLTACAGKPAPAPDTADAAGSSSQAQDVSAAPEAVSAASDAAQETESSAVETAQPAAQETDDASASDEAEAKPAQTPAQPSAPDTAPAPAEPAAQETGSKTLVAYFSATGNTKAVAEQIAALTGAALYEIVPAVPYTADDLDYNVSDCRANREMNDPSARPALSDDSLDVSDYDTILLGYPLWWGTMPRIIQTFLDTYDLSGKVILPFCTSGSSSIAQSVAELRSAVPEADVQDGLRAQNAQDSSIEGWLRDSGVLA